MRHPCCGGPRNTLLGLGDELVLIIDDAHLADDLTLAVCGALADSARMPVVLAARSTEAHPDGLAHIAQIPGVRTLQLDVLGIEETAALVSQMERADIDADSVKEVYSLTNGVPLVVRELVRAARDSGRALSSEHWAWDSAIATDPGLSSLFTGRLRHTSDEARSVLWITVAADGAVPEQAAVCAVSRAAVDETLERGLLSEANGWLVWSHALLGQLAVESLSRANIDAARRTLSVGLAAADRDDPEVVRLSARVDLESPSPDFELQLAAADIALNDGLDSEALSHADAALSVAPDSHEANLTAAFAAIRLGRSEAPRYLGRALDTCTTDEQYLHTTTQGALLIFATSGDADASIGVVAGARARIAEPRLGHRLDYIRMYVQITALSPEDFLAAATEYLAAADTHPRDRTAAEGLLSIMLATLGDIERASTAAAALRARAGQVQLDYDEEAGYYGGALAALFGGDAHEASRLVAEGSRIPPSVDRPGVDVGRRSMACTMGQARGHCDVGMPEFIKPADESASLRYAVMIRIYALWELALRRDPRADVVREELQAAPKHIRVGPGFLEAIAEVALMASKGDIEQAGETALTLAESMGPARSAAAWLLHDAARHGRAPDAIGDLDSIAASQPARYLPAIFSDSARAMHSGDPAALVVTASEFRTGGFDLFAAELEVLALERHRAGADDRAARVNLTRALEDLGRAGDPWTPIVGALEERVSLTQRQREICRLVVLGLSNSQIARELGISKRTVENQLHRSYATLGVDRAGLSDIHF